MTVLILVSIYNLSSVYLWSWYTV